jgi:hypothetical protein
MQVHGADPTEVTHLSTKQYVDTQIANVPGSGQQFYLSVGETEPGPVFTDINGIRFNTEQFYVTQNAPNTDEVIVNSRGDFRDPLFRQATIGTAAQTNIGTPLPVGAIVKRVKLVISQRYDSPAVEITVESLTGAANQVWMSADENDPRNNKEEVFISETDPRQTAIDGTRQAVANVTNTPGAGEAVVLLEYLLP